MKKKCFSNADYERIVSFASLGEMAGGIIHDLRNPLSAIVLTIEVLEKKLGENDELNRLKKCTQRMVAITDNTLSFVRQSSDSSSLNLWTELRKALALFGNLKGEDIDVRMECMECEQIPPIFASSSQVQRILANLIGNAKDAIISKRNGGGTISLKCRRVEDVLVLKISDDGVGIARKNMKKIFKPLFTTKKEGSTGLGLQITQQCVSNIGGKISVESKVSVGTTFTVEFPLQKKGGME